jgi:hypothetical protein
MTDLRTMTIEGLCGRYRWGNPDGVLAELRRRDEATRKLVEAANRVILWMDDNGYRPDDQSFGLRAALAQFPKE